MNKNRISEIRFIGIIITIFAIVVAFRYIPMIRLLQLFAFVKYIASVPIDMVPVIFVMILCSLNYICFILAGIAFLFLKKWGYILLRICVLIDMTFHLFYMLNLWMSWFVIGRSFVAPQGKHVIKIDILPIYFVFLAEIAIFYLITRPKVKEQFK